MTADGAGKKARRKRWSQEGKQRPGSTKGDGIIWRIRQTSVVTLVSLGEGNTSRTFWLTLQGKKPKSPNRSDTTQVRVYYINAHGLFRGTENIRSRWRASAKVSRPGSPTGHSWCTLLGEHTGETDEVISRQINLNLKVAVLLLHMWSLHTCFWPLTPLW